MDEVTLEALKGGIKKWEDICNGTGRDEGPINCTLCQQFVSLALPTVSICHGCPVALKVKASGCQDTPYADWMSHQRGHGNFTGSYDIQTGCKECLKLAKKELIFLKSLLPKEMCECGFIPCDHAYHLKKGTKPTVTAETST